MLALATRSMRDLKELLEKVLSMIDVEGAQLVITVTGLQIQSLALLEHTDQIKVWDYFIFLA